MSYRFESSVSIQASPEHVWSVIQNPERRLEWDTRVAAVEQLTPGPVGKGLRIRVTYKLLGMPHTVELETVSWQPPRRSGVKGLFIDSDDTMAGSWNFTSDEQGTTVWSTKLVLNCKGRFGRLRELILGWMTFRLTKVSQANLKRLIEAEVRGVVATPAAGD